MDIEEAVYREHGPALLTYLSARAPKEIAEDLHQDVWLRALKEERQLEGTDLRRWLFTVAKNLLLDYVNKASTRREKSGLSGPEPKGKTLAPIDILIDKEEYAKMRACIQQLKKESREVVKGRLAGESSKETAQRLNMKPATVDTSFLRAKELLAECMNARASQT